MNTFFSCYRISWFTDSREAHSVNGSLFLWRDRILATVSSAAAITTIIFIVLLADPTHGSQYFGATGHNKTPAPTTKSAPPKAPTSIARGHNRRRVMISGNSIPTVLLKCSFMKFTISFAVTLV